MGRDQGPGPDDRPAVNERPEVRIRPLRPDDHTRLVSLWRRAGLPFRPRGRDGPRAFAEACRESPDLLLAAVAGGRLVGAVVGSHDGRKGWINRLAVDPEWRRAGVGRRLVEGVERALRQRGIEVIGALVEEESAASHGLFRALGYGPHAGVRYYSKRRSEES